MTKSILTLERARELFEYDSDTGLLTRRISLHVRWPIGTLPGSIHPKGYRFVNILGRLYPIHRIAWLLVHGVWPTGDIDHINGDRLDNRLANLRDVSRQVNLQNRRQARKGKQSCDLLGVTWTGKRWRAQIKFDGKKRSLGDFDTPEAAQAVYLEAKRKHHAGFVEERWAT